MAGPSVLSPHTLMFAFNLLLSLVGPVYFFSPSAFWGAHFLSQYVTEVGEIMSSGGGGGGI